MRKGLTEQKEKTDKRRKDGDPIRQEAEVAQAALKEAEEINKK